MMVQLANLRAILKARLRQEARRQMASALLGGLALLFMITAIVAAIAAIGVALAAHWGALAACLIIATVALLVALLLIVVVIQQQKQARRRQQADLAQLRQAMLAAKILSADLTSSKALLATTVLGVLVGLTAVRNQRGANT